MSPYLIAGYAAVAVIGGWLLVDARGGWQAKLAVIAIAPMLSFALWQAAQPAQGWPYRSQPPRLAEIEWGLIDEPDPQTNDPGAIYLWLVPAGATRPRAYRLPYTRQMHEQLLRALAAIKHGQPMMLARNGKRGHGQGHGARQRGAGIRFYREPPPGVPRKQP